MSPCLKAARSLVIRTFVLSSGEFILENIGSSSFEIASNGMNRREHSLSAPVFGTISMSFCRASEIGVPLMTMTICSR